MVLVLLVMVVVSSNTTEAAIRNPYTERFFELYDIIHNYKVNQKTPQDEFQDAGYFSPEGVPYHAFETFLCEAPDYGHETTSETYSYYLWLEAMYFKLTKDYAPFRTALESMEDYIIPSPQDQPIYENPGNEGTVKGGRYAKQSITVEDYPVLMWSKRGKKPDDSYFPLYPNDDPLAKELKKKYGNKQVYGMHWLLDTDNFYGFGYRGDLFSTRKATYLATCERGGSESSWNTIPHPNWKDHRFGNNTSNTHGFADIFLNSEYGWEPEYSYSVATDADARAIQASYLAAKVLEKTRRSNPLALRNLSAKMGKMGNFLRYGMRTKYFMPLGRKFAETFTPVVNPDPALSKYDHQITVLDPDNKNGNVHYLLGWNYAWGARLDGIHPWRIGDDNVHAAYQNPMAAYALTKFNWFNQELTDTTSYTEGGKQEWSTSLIRQLDLIRWLQTYEGAIGGGVTNCWEGQYKDPNLGKSPGDPGYVNSFHGMYYTPSPVYIGRDPITGNPNPNGDSNAWFGWQVWLMQRLAELYNELDKNTETQLRDKLSTILDQWINWAMNEAQMNPSATDPMDRIKLPAELTWENQPDADWSGGSGSTPPRNYNYKVHVGTHNTDISITGNFARTLIYYAAGRRKHIGNDATVTAARNMAQQILDLLYTSYKDERGYTNTYMSREYVDNFFNAKIYVPGTRLGPNEIEEPDPKPTNPKNTKKVNYASPNMVKREGALPANMGDHKAGSRYGDVISKLTSSDDPNNAFGYMTYDQIRAKFEDNPGPQGADDINYDKLMAAYNDPSKKVTISYHRFFSQVEIALAFAEFGLYFGDEAETSNEINWGPLTIDANAASNYGVYGSAHTDFHDRAKLYLNKSTVPGVPSTYGQIGVGKGSSSNPQMILGYASDVGNVICGQPKLWIRGPVRVGDVLAAGEIDWGTGFIGKGEHIALDNLCKDNPDRDLGFLNYTFDASKCYTSSDHINVGNGQTIEKWNGTYGNINVGSNGRLSLKGGGVFYCNNFATEPDAILDIDTSTHPVIIIAKGNVDIKSRTQMNVTNDDASKLLIITASQNQVYLAPDAKWRGTLFAPNTGYLNVDIGSKIDAKGAFIGKSVVIHQDTDIIQVPFQYELLTTSLPGYRTNAPSAPSNTGSSSGWSWWNWSW